MQSQQRSRSGDGAERSHHPLKAVAVGLNPIGYADIVGGLAVDAAMIVTLAGVYGMEMKWAHARTLALSIAKAAGWITISVVVTTFAVSTLKALTALTLIPRLRASAKVVVQPEDVRVEGSRVGILAGTAYTVHSLFQGLLMVSGNDAAYALSRANGSVAVTVEEMNATATGLGAFDTVAKGPSGLDKPGQTSSAYDLALIGRAPAA